MIVFLPLGGIIARACSFICGGEHFLIFVVSMFIATLADLVQCTLISAWMLWRPKSREQGLQCSAKRRTSANAATRFFQAIDSH